jgi:hypothetical protein
MKSRFLAALLLSGLASVAEAGVAGLSFSGLITLAGGETGISSASFEAGTGRWSLSRQFLSSPQPVVQQGRFTETDLFVVSLIEGTLGTGANPRPVTGVAILGTVMTLTFPGPGGTPLADGVYVVQGSGTPFLSGASAPRPRASACLGAR